MVNRLAEAIKRFDQWCGSARAGSYIAQAAACSTDKPEEAWRRGMHILSSLNYMTLAQREEVFELLESVVSHVPDTTLTRDLNEMGSGISGASHNYFDGPQQTLSHEAQQSVIAFFENLYEKSPALVLREAVTFTVKPKPGILREGLTKILEEAARDLSPEIQAVAGAEIPRLFYAGHGMEDYSAEGLKALEVLSAVNPVAAAKASIDAIRNLLGANMQAVLCRVDPKAQAKIDRLTKIYAGGIAVNYRETAGYLLSGLTHPEKMQWWESDNQLACLFFDYCDHDPAGITGPVADLAGILSKSFCLDFEVITSGLGVLKKGLADPETARISVEMLELVSENPAVVRNDEYADVLKSAVNSADHNIAQTGADMVFRQSIARDENARIVVVDTEENLTLLRDAFRAVDEKRASLIAATERAKSAWLKAFTLRHAFGHAHADGEAVAAHPAGQSPGSPAAEDELAL